MREVLKGLWLVVSWSIIGPFVALFAVLKMLGSEENK